MTKIQNHKLEGSEKYPISAPAVIPAIAGIQAFLVVVEPICFTTS